MHLPKLSWSRFLTTCLKLWLEVRNNVIYFHEKKERICFFIRLHRQQYGTSHHRTIVVFNAVMLLCDDTTQCFNLLLGCEMIVFGWLLKIKDYYNSGVYIMNPVVNVNVWYYVREMDHSSFTATITHKTRITIFFLFVNKNTRVYYALKTTTTAFSGKWVSLPNRRNGSNMEWEIILLNEFPLRGHRPEKKKIKRKKQYFQVCFVTRVQGFVWTVTVFFCVVQKIIIH